MIQVREEALISTITNETFALDLQGCVRDDVDLTQWSKNQKFLVLWLGFLEKRRRENGFRERERDFRMRYKQSQSVKKTEFSD